MEAINIERTEQPFPMEKVITKYGQEHSREPWQPNFSRWANVAVRSRVGLLNDVDILDEKNCSSKQLCGVLTSMNAESCQNNSAGVIFSDYVQSGVKWHRPVSYRMGLMHRPMHAAKAEVDGDEIWVSSKYTLRPRLSETIARRHCFIVTMLDIKGAHVEGLGERMADDFARNIAKLEPGDAIEVTIAIPARPNLFFDLIRP